MSGRIIPIDPLADQRWERFIGAHPLAHICHTSAWLEVLQRSFGYQPAHLAYEQDGQVLGVLPLMAIRSRFTGQRLVSLPFSGPAGPLGNSREVVDALVGAATRQTLAGGFGYLNLQTRGTDPALSWAAMSTTQPFVCSVVPLDADPAVVWRRIRIQQCRRDIRRAASSGVVVTRAARFDPGTFYPLLIQTSRKHGVPPPPYRHFELIAELLGPRQMLQVFDARLDGRLITSMLCFSYKHILSACYVGTDYRFLRVHPVKAVDWAAMTWACQAGYREFDFLQSHVRNDGLRWYKRSFGASETPVTFHYFPRVGSTALLRELLVGKRFGVARLAHGLLRHLPTPALCALGEALFPHVG